MTLAAGNYHTCAISTSGNAYCWGYNYGAVGDGTSDHRSSPTAVAGALTFKRISSGTGHGCGVTTADAIYCWGENDNGELGDGTTAPRLAPVPVRWP